MDQNSPEGSSAGDGGQGPYFYTIGREREECFLTQAFEDFLVSGHLTDLLLSCADGGRSLRCHKLVLSAGSGYFRDLFGKLPKNDSAEVAVVVLKDVQFQDLRLVVEYIYKGKVTLESENLQGFLRAADILKLKGIAATGLESDGNGNQNEIPEVEENAEAVGTSFIRRVPKDELGGTACDFPVVISDDRMQTKGKDCHCIMPSGESTAANCKKKCSRRRSEYSDKQLADAVSAVQNGMRCVDASRKYGVPSRTLYYRKRGMDPSSSSILKGEKPSSQSSFRTGSPQNSDDEDEDEDFISRKSAKKSKDNASDHNTSVKSRLKFPIRSS